MKISSKEYKIIQTQNFVKNKNLFFIFNSSNKKAIKSVQKEQELKKNRFNYHRILNKTFQLALRTSVLYSISPVINGSTFFLENNFLEKPLTKSLIFNKLKLLRLSITAIKLNNNTYSITSLKNLNTTSYVGNALLFLQYKVTISKVTFLSISK